MLLQILKDHIKNYWIHFTALYCVVFITTFYLTCANMTLWEQLERKPLKEEFKHYILTREIINLVPEEE